MKNKRGPRGRRFAPLITLIIAILAAVNHFLLEDVATVAGVTSYLT